MSHSFDESLVQADWIKRLGLDFPGRKSEEAEALVRRVGGTLPDPRDPRDLMEQIRQQ